VTRPRVDPTTLGRVQRALEGRCPDCKGNGERKNAQGRVVTCPTCGGHGQLSSMSFAQVACSAESTLAKTIDAILDLEESGRAERVRGSDDPELWRPKRRTG